MEQWTLFESDDGEGTYIAETPAQTDPQVERTKAALTDPADGASSTGASRYPADEGQLEILHRLLVTSEDLFAPTDLGDAVRCANFAQEDIYMTVDPEGQPRLLLYNAATGMLRMEGNRDFLPLYDVKLSEANEQAIEVAEEDPTVSNQVRGRLRRHVAALGAGSVAKALRRSARLVDDPCVPINRVAASSLNRVDRHPVLLCEHEPVRLSDGTVADPADLKGHFLLDMTPAPTAFVPDAAHSEAPGAAMMLRFLRYLGNGDEMMLCRRLGWQLCGHHTTIDVIAGDHHALSLLARALQDVLGPSGARVLSAGRDLVRARHIASAMEQARLCLWTGADTTKTIPVRELEALVSYVDPRRQGNLILLVADWPDDWETLDHRIASKCGWAWLVQGSLLDEGIDPEVMLDRDGRELLLAMLVEGAVGGFHQFQATKEENGIGDPGQVAATEYSLACAEEMRVAGAKAEHRILYRALQFTDDAQDVMTLAEIDDAITSADEEPIPHNVVGKTIRQMWQRVEGGRPRIDRKQDRVIRRIAPRSHDAYEQPDPLN